MGLFVHFRGRFECVRCRRTSDASIQTKLLRHAADNAGRDYQVGDAEELVGLDDHHLLHPWNGRCPLTVAVGDWDCEHCGLAWQWAKVTFEVAPVDDCPTATITELTGLLPDRVSALDGIHFVVDDLARLSGMWEEPPKHNWSEGLARWQASSVVERCERIVAGFRDWCREVAGVELPP